jgi:hypothetical protein
MWFTYNRDFSNQLKCHFLQIELHNRFLQMLHQSIKVSLIVVSVEPLIYLLIIRPVLTLSDSVDNPSETPLSHLEDTTILKRRMWFRV